MNKNILEYTKLKAYRSQHNLIGLDHFDYLMNTIKRELTIYYKGKVLERYFGKDAVDIWKQFDTEITAMPHLFFNEVYELCCDIVNRDIKQKTRNDHVVFGRSLFFLYFKKFSKYSLASIGAVFDKDHATVLHGLNKIVDFKDEGYLTGWRKEMKEEFEYKVNCKHKKCGIDKFFKHEETH